MTARTLGQVAAILAAAPSVQQITRPRDPSAQEAGTAVTSTDSPQSRTDAEHKTSPATAPATTRPGTRHESNTITERAARVALAQIGVGGGLQAHRMTNGWLFAPFTMFSASLAPGTSWLVTHDGQPHDLGDVEGSPVVRG